MASIDSRLSPYAFGANNPVLFNDPLGLYVDTLFDPVVYPGGWLEEVTVRGYRNMGYSRAEASAYHAASSAANHARMERMYNYVYGLASNRSSGTSVQSAPPPRVVGIAGLREAQSGGGGDGGLGNWLSGFDIAAGAYSEYGHNHTTYKTTKGIEKNIFKANGQVRSARAAGFARASSLVRGVAVVGSIASTAYSGYKVANQIKTGGLQNVNGWDVTDAGVGIIGLGATGAAYLGLISNPVGWVIGAGVLIYSGSRLAYDLYNEP